MTEYDRIKTTDINDEPPVSPCGRCNDRAKCKRIGFSDECDQYLSHLINLQAWEES